MPQESFFTYFWRFNLGLGLLCGIHGPPVTFLANLMQIGSLSLLKQKMKRPARDLAADRQETDRQGKDRRGTNGQETDKHK